MSDLEKAGRSFRRKEREILWKNDRLPFFADYVGKEGTIVIIPAEERRRRGVREDRRGEG